VIQGSFYPDDVPRVTVKLYLPRLDKRGTVHPLIDTGAGLSLIHPSDAKRLHLDFERDFQERPRDTVEGIGGKAEVWREEAEITFRCKDEEVLSVKQQILIAVPTGDNQNLQSLLGRDVLHTFRLLYSFPSRELMLGQP